VRWLDRKSGSSLGFSFSSSKEPKPRIAPKALRRCKQKIRETDKTDTRDQSGLLFALALALLSSRSATIEGRGKN